MYKIGPKILFYGTSASKIGDSSSSCLTIKLDSFNMIREVKCMDTIDVFQL